MAITDPDKAMRLARAICEDIRLYNAEAMKNVGRARGAALETALTEGRELYVSRVSPSFDRFFGEAALELLEVDVSTLRPMQDRPDRGDANPHPPTRQEQAGIPMLPIALGLLALSIVLAGAFFAMLR